MSGPFAVVAYRSIPDRRREWSNRSGYRLMQQLEHFAQLGKRCALRVGGGGPRSAACRRGGSGGVRPKGKAPGEGGGDGVRPFLNSSDGSRIVEDELDEIDVAVGSPVECDKVASGLDEDHPAINRWGHDAVGEGNAAVGG